MSLESIPIENSENDTDKLTFHNACAKGKLSVVKIYLAEQGFNMNIGDNYGRTGFHYACGEGNLNVAQFLLEQGFDMKICDNNGYTGFHYACFNGKLNVIQFLLEQGFDWNVGDNHGKTGFHFACFNGKLNVIQFLLRRGFHMNAVDNRGKTGFHYACFNGKLNVIQFLLQRGFHMNAVDNRGKTGFHAACLHGKLYVIQFFLLQYGFEGINALDVNGMNGLNLLIQHRWDVGDNELFMPCILVLIEAGAELDENDVFEGLISAIQNRVIEITFMKETLFQKWTGRIAQAITDFVMDPIKNTSLQNLSEFLD